MAWDDLFDLGDLVGLLWKVFGWALFLIVAVVATPFILLWPRSDTSQPYAEAVAERYGHLAGVIVFSPFNEEDE